MSFGFGSNNNNSGGSTFGGFGASNNTGFGANNNNNNAATTTGSSLFGGSTATTGAFGGFGANNNNNNNNNNSTASNPFAASKPGFGASTTATTGGGLFGSNSGTTGGGFGGGTGFGNTANTNTGFGANNTTGGGGLFGSQNKPATGGFGSSNTGGSLFGGTGTTGGFGANSGTTAANPFATNTNNSSTGFGATNAGTGGFGGGFGGAAVVTNNGTASVPFNAVQEKEGTGGVTQHYQSITFQDPYKNQSFEELRVQDYAQGRKYGNTNGQAGGFGQSTGFGGANNSTNVGGGLFGSNNNTNTASTGTGFGGGFGSTTNNTTGGFGGNTGGGLFGQNKPATGGGLFGNNAASSAPAANPFGSTSGSTGGLFGSNTGGGFGATNTANTGTTGGGLFGNTNNQQQNTNPFGGTSNTSGGLFGQQNKPATGGLFGSTPANNTTNTGAGLFGSSNNQQQQGSNLFGGASNTTSGGLFGNTQQNQPKSTGAFGGFGQSTNTGGAFGNNTNTTGGGLFGNNNNQQQQQSNTGGLFGNSQNKPAGGGLFGNSTNTGGSLFGNNTNNQQQQQNTTGGGGLFGNSGTGGSLFGNNNNANKPATGSLFGNAGTSNTGGSLFGNSQSNQNNTGGSLFGNNNQNQQNQGSSLFGNTNNQQQQQPNQLHASLTGAPYGNEQLFASLATTNPPVGPLATPLSGARPAARKTPSLLTSMRLNSPVYTPRGGSIGRNAGYGFSYSTYGTPGSAYSGALTPGANSLLRPTGSFGSALSNRLNKSISMGNLRGDGTPGERPSLLRESALSPPGSGAARYGSGSVRKLNIDRSLRTDLFGPAKEPEQSSRRARFEDVPEDNSSQQRPSDHNALVRTESSDTEQEESPALLRAAPQSNGPSRQPEMSQAKSGSNGLSTVPEDGVPQRPGSAPATQQKSAPKSTGAVMKDSEPGDYWTKPDMRDLKNMSRSQLQKIGKFVVGRNGVGRVEFSACDLSTTQLDDICGGVVRLNPRSATVYQDDKDKPAMGKALNVPSTIFLDNSWPRSHGGRKAVHAREGREYEKHIARLKRVGGTNFVNYDSDTGVWQFTVEHFTTYGLDDDDDDEDFTEQSESSGLSEAPATLARDEVQEDETMESIENGSGEVDDTFEFKVNRRSHMSVPGGFDEPSVSYDYDDPSADEQMEEDQQDESEAEMDTSFKSSGGAVQAPSPGAVERYHSSMLEDDEQTGDVSMSGGLGMEEEEVEEEQEMPGAFAPEPKMLRSILKPSRGIDAFASPEKLVTESWEDQLQRTISPRKRDRLALKDMQQSLMKAQEREEGIESPFKQSMLGRSMMGQSALGQSYLAQKSAKKGKVPAEDLGKSRAFTTSMDIMSSLWADQQVGSGRKAGTGFEYPYAKKPRLSQDDDDSHNPCLKPSFSADNTLVYAAAGSAPYVTGEMVQSKQSIVGEHIDVRFAKFASPASLVDGTIETMQTFGTTLSGKDEGLPSASTRPDLLFKDLATKAMQGPDAEYEVPIWHLCSSLFDPLDAIVPDLADMPKEQQNRFASRLRLDEFKQFWSSFVDGDVDAGLKRTKSAEEKALLHLTKGNVTAACDTLVAVKNYRLATLIAQLPTPESTMQVMERQIEGWRKRKDWSEMSDGIRTLYSILAGEVCIVAGQTGAAEDRASEFCISERFALTWQQSLALRVLYGGHATLEDAIKAYCEDVETGRELVKPTAGEDAADYTLMTLCRLFAVKKEGIDAATLCEPATVSGSALNARVAWQLAAMLGAKGLLTLPEDKMARLTIDLAVQMEVAGKLAESAWVLLHLRERSDRQRAITGLLHRNADKLMTSGEQLSQHWQIPKSMIFNAQAMYAKANTDAHGQVHFLLRAGQVAEAQEVLCASVGPRAIIEQDVDALALVNEFPRPRPIGWEKGGQVYEAYLQLAQMNQAQRHSKEGESAVARLRRVLKHPEEMPGKTLEQRVATIEMRRFVEDVAKAQGDERKHGRSKVGDTAATVMLEKYRAAVGQVF